MYHSITFGDKNTWDDFKLVATSRPLFLPPPVKTNYVEVPGADGKLDLTTLLTGEPMYGNRTGSIELYVMNGYSEWSHRYSEIMNFLHGQAMNVVLEDDPGYYYTGRFSVNKWASEKERSKITIDYDLAPYKMEIQTSSEDWIWDTFDFEIGIIREYGNLIIDGTKTIEVIGCRKSVIPKFIVSLDDPNKFIKVTREDGSQFLLTNGEFKVPNVKISNSSERLTFTGKGIVSIDFRGGSL